MSITLYGSIRSPPARAVRLVCAALGIKYEFKIVDLGTGAHKTPEFIKMNPLQTIPTLQDGDFSLYDSHAIVAYLADKYGKDDSFYPKDIRKRAIVNARLHFNNATILSKFLDFALPVMRGTGPYDPARGHVAGATLATLDTLLGDSLWLAGGEGPTIADCCCAASVESVKRVVPSAPVPPGVGAWLERCEKHLPEYNSINTQGADELGKIFFSKIPKSAPS